MTHRTDVEWIDLTEPMTTIKKKIAAAKHSKIICSEGTIDEFKGVLNIQDYYKAIATRKSADILELMQEPFIVPEKIDAQQVLNEMRKRENRMCFVVNEYGGFEGIITMLDILENLIGEIKEEGEPEEPDYFVREDGSILMNGDAAVEVLADIIEGFELDFSETEYNTVAGFALSILNHIPHTGEKFTAHGHSFEIIDMDGTRIDKLLISVL